MTSNKFFAYSLISVILASISIFTVLITNPGSSIYTTLIVIIMMSCFVGCHIIMITQVFNLEHDRFYKESIISLKIICALTLIHVIYLLFTLSFLPAIVLILSTMFLMLSIRKMKSSSVGTIKDMFNSRFDNMSIACLNLHKSTVFVHKNDITDIVLPYQLLSVEKSVKEGQHFMLNDESDNYYEMNFDEEGRILIKKEPGMNNVYNRLQYNVRDYVDISNSDTIKLVMEDKDMTKDELIDWYKRKAKLLSLSEDELRELVNDYSKAYDELMKINTIEYEKKMNDSLTNSDIGSKQKSSMYEELKNIIK